MRARTRSESGWSVTGRRRLLQAWPAPLAALLAACGGESQSTTAGAGAGAQAPAAPGRPELVFVWQPG